MRLGGSHASRRLPRSRTQGLVASGQIDAKPFITHHFGLDEFEEAYDVFDNAADTGALKVVLSR